jgi:hypothetical protein
VQISHDGTDLPPPQTTVNREYRTLGRFDGPGRKEWIDEAFQNSPMNRSCLSSGKPSPASQSDMSADNPVSIHKPPMSGKEKYAHVNGDANCSGCDNMKEEDASLKRLIEDLLLDKHIQ